MSVDASSRARETRSTAAMQEPLEIWFSARSRFRRVGYRQTSAARSIRGVTERCARFPVMRGGVCGPAFRMVEPIGHRLGKPLEVSICRGLRQGCASHGRPSSVRAAFESSHFVSSQMGTNRRRPRTILKRVIARPQ